MEAVEVKVSQAQFDRIEAAWDICSYGNGRKAQGLWAKSFNQCVSEVLGFAAPECFKLVVM